MSETLTPMMHQYLGIRRSLPTDVILFFRLGDFYEMFFEDAKIASSILNVALTKRGTTPMCGVPYHAAQGYIAKLIEAGKRVAICDQVSEPQPGKIVQREISQIISAGTVSDLNLLRPDRHQYLVSIREKGGRFGLACLDLSTGEFRVTELPDEDALQDEINRIAPSELLVGDDQLAVFSTLGACTAHDAYAFEKDQAQFTLTEHFRVSTLDGFGCTDLPAAIGAAGGMFHYLQFTMRRKLDHVKRLQVYRTEGYLVIDSVTRDNLELVFSKGGKSATLLGALDRTLTPMGARTLRDWLLHPLRDLEPLKRRQEAVMAFFNEAFLLSQIRESLRGVRDIERTLSRLSQGSGNARDLAALVSSLEPIPALREHLTAANALRSVQDTGKPFQAGLLQVLHDSIREFPDLLNELGRALMEAPPLTIKDGGMIAKGYDATLDELRNASGDGKAWIAEMQQREIERSGIKSLKIKFNSVFGYFIEITKSNLASVPADYHRKQTTVNAERYITPELKEMEGKILGADERAKALEYEIFLRLRERVVSELEALQETAGAIGCLDVLLSLAETARLYGYTRPELHAGLEIDIREGRHPVLDQRLVEEKFVPNDLCLDGEKNRLLLITGPNMAGKSTYIRQSALLVLMAQTGSFLPAKSAKIGLADRIFTRVGASDDLSRGQSTFMVEMTETANILNNATEKSLVILDEIGRGTSTFDGLSIAWSVAEFLHDQPRARTLFATHFHEMTELATSREGVKNFSVAVREWNDEIIFLRKILPGAADRSYGIQVARLAGLPAEVLERAKTILRNLETTELSAEGKSESGARKILRKRLAEEKEKEQLKFL